MFYRLPLVRKLSESSISTAGSVKYFDRLSARCEGLNTNTLLSIRKKISLYLHPVTRDDEMNAAHHPTSKRKTEERHRAEAELRKVYVIFVNAEIDAKISEDESENDEMYEKLNQIINTVSEVLEEFRGHMRQFIVDDKGEKDYCFTFVRRKSELFLKKVTTFSCMCRCCSNCHIRPAGLDVP